jgi:bifunctional non-homologous end joining protein LigD
MQPITHLDLMHATPARLPHSKPGWIYELKHDGFRVLAVKAGRTIRLLSRGGKDMAASFPELVLDLRRLKRDFAIDGEMVIRVNGREDFGALVTRLGIRKGVNVAAASRRRPAVILAFDLLTRWSTDLRFHPLLTRKAELQELIASSERICYVPHIEVKGLELYGQAVAQGLEGIMGKQENSKYIAGRSRYWIKVETPAGRKRSRPKYLGK